MSNVFIAVQRTSDGEKGELIVSRNLKSGRVDVIPLSRPDLIRLLAQAAMTLKGVARV